MKWIKYTIETSTAAEDIIGAMLMELGVEGVQIEDSLTPSSDDLCRMYVDPEARELAPDEMPEIDGSRITFYLKTENDPDDESLQLDSSATVDASYTIHDRLWSSGEVAELISSVRTGLSNISEYVDIGSGTIRADLLEGTEWLDKWKDFYRPLVIGNVLIIPFWESIPAEYETAVQTGELKVVMLNPGSAFGSGSHDTTKLCMDALCRYLLPGQKLIDVGAGSGILGLAALRNGAAYVRSIEIDPACRHIMEENRELNHIQEERMEISIGNILEDENLRAAAGSDYDILTANILANVTVTLTEPGQADALVRSGGYFITTGIAAQREGEVREAFARNNNWRIVEKTQRGDWICLIAERL